MSDEIYEKLVYDGAEHVSVASFSPAHYDHTIVVHGFACEPSLTVQVTVRVLCSP